MIAELVAQPARRDALVARSPALLHGEMSMEQTVARFLTVLRTI